MSKKIEVRYPVVLASASPRRQELLQKLIETFEVLPAHADEEALADQDPWITVQRTAREKALTVSEKRADALVIAGDTTVALKNNAGDYILYPKPLDRADAKRILQDLSGKEHLVITGVALKWPKGLHVFTDTTHVIFRQLSSQEIEKYVETGEADDKAGAYAIQGRAKEFVREIRGSLTNVIGLPLEALQRALREVH
jgi:septum formation protein